MHAKWATLISLAVAFAAVAVGLPLTPDYGAVAPVRATGHLWAEKRVISGESERVDREQKITQLKASRLAYEFGSDPSISREKAVENDQTLTLLLEKWEGDVEEKRISPDGETIQKNKELLDELTGYAYERVKKYLVPLPSLRGETASSLADRIEFSLNNPTDYLSDTEMFEARVRRLDRIVGDWFYMHFLELINWLVDHNFLVYPCRSRGDIYATPDSLRKWNEYKTLVQNAWHTLDSTQAIHFVND
ncbi:hypothetical protein FRB99_005584 [Tulasnella sp. 403]|nr:hypothetical protein FRB99_005584 [Tulasnella sp. 403]